MPALERLRRRGYLVILVMAWSTIPLVLTIGMSLHQSALPGYVAAAVLTNLLPTAAWYRGRVGFHERLLAATVVTVQPALLVFVMRGQPWQMDTHIYFLMALASLTLLCDWRPILTAACMMILHHIVLAYAAPHWAFTDKVALGRILLHGGAVVVEAGLLIYVTCSLHALIRADHASRVRSDGLAAEADAARQAADAARLKAESALAIAAEVAEREGWHIAQSSHAERHRREMLRLADRFETSVVDVVEAVRRSAADLTHLSGALEQAAMAAGDSASDLKRLFANTAGAVRSVATRLSELSRATTSIADEASQQVTLTHAAQTDTAKGISAVSDLSGDSNRIDSFATTILDIASRTNLLALNASIEAARAGSAGQGFAVVAHEIKVLAAQASAAAADIHEIVQALEHRTAQTTVLMRNVQGATVRISDASSSIHAMTARQREAATAIVLYAEDAASDTERMATAIAGVDDASAASCKLAVRVDGSANSLLEAAQRLTSVTVSFMHSLRMGGQPGLDRRIEA